jgi:hypothetical protein
VLERNFSNTAGKTSHLSQEDLRFLSIPDNNIYFNSKADRYEMPLPFKTPNPSLPNNKVLAVSRIKSLQSMLQTDERFH